MAIYDRVKFLERSEDVFDQQFSTFIQLSLLNSLKVLSVKPSFLFLGGIDILLFIFSLANKPRPILSTES